MKVGVQQLAGRLKAAAAAKKSIIENIGCALGAFVMANAFLYGSMAPFGVSFAASVKKERLLAAAAGAIAGYTLSFNPANNMKYIIASVILLAVRWVLSESRFGRADSPAVPVLTLLAVLAANSTVLSVGRPTPYDFVLAASEAVLAGGSSFFIARSLQALENRESLLSLNRSDLSSLIITFALAMMALGGWTVYGLSVGRIAAVFIILLCAKYGHEAAGAVAGVTAGAAMGLLGGGFSFLAAAYGFGGLVAGMFSSFGSFGCAVLFVIVNGVVSLVLGGEGETIPALCEVFSASLLFVLLPGRWSDRLMLARRAKTSAVTETAKDILLSKLEFASEALADISATTQQVGEKLLSMQTDDLTAVYGKGVEAACRRCPQRAECWGAAFSDSMDSLNHLGPILRRRGRIAEQDLSGRLGEICVNKEKLVRAVSEEYALYAQRQGSKRRVAQVRGVVTDQFEGLSLMLESLSQELAQIYETDGGKNRAIADLFQNENIELISASSYTDQHGRLSVEVVIPSYKTARLPKVELTAALSDLCDTSFDLPAVRQAEERTRLLWHERANLAAEYGRAQIACKEGKLCGDCADFLLDGRGRAHLILSDGMGSGGKAAVDAAMTVSLLSRLINAGFEFDAALKMVNSALLVKSNEESLSTIDIACVDLYTGHTQFLKAGAAPSYVVRTNTVGKVESMSMPAGILRGVQFEKNRMTLREGDIVVMISDGVILTGADWLIPQIKISKELPAQAMAEEIANTAKARRTDHHDDDITVTVMKLHKGV